MVRKTCLYTLLAVIAITLIKAQEQSHDSHRPNRGPNNDQRRPPFEISFPPFFGSGFQFPSFGSNAFGDRSREPSRHEGKNNGPGNQNVFREIVRCNFTEQPGNSCISCNKALICSRLNLGIVITCRGHRPHCNNGHCSSTPVEACNSTYTE